MEEEKQTEGKSGYDKRPLWQWIALYVVIAIFVYGVIYYVFLNKQNSYSANTQASSQQPTQQMQQPTQSAENTVYKMVKKDKIGMVLADPKGMTLYTFTKDTQGVSNCSSGCMAAWPVYKAPSQTGTFPTNITVIKRSDGTLQYAWKGMPLYYYAKDGDSGDAYGNGVGGVWSVVQ